MFGFIYNSGVYNRLGLVLFLKGPVHECRILRIRAVSADIGKLLSTVLERQNFQGVSSHLSIEANCRISLILSMTLLSMSIIKHIQSTNSI